MPLSVAITYAITEKEGKSGVGNAPGGNLFYTNQTRRRPSSLNSAVRDKQEV